MIERRGNIIAPVAAHVSLSAVMPRVYAVASFDNHHSLETQTAMWKHLRGLRPRYMMQSAYLDALGGEPRFVALVYSSPAELRVCRRLLKATRAAVGGVADAKPELEETYHEV